MTNFERIQVIDSHTGGEPTRVVIDGGPKLVGTLAEQREQLRVEHDHFRSAIVNEPRGWDAMVGALLCEPIDPNCTAGVVFFNNVGYLGMCVHGMIGVVATLAHLGRMRPGSHKLETPVGVVTVALHEDGQVSVRNVPSFRWAKCVRIAVDGYGDVIGDVAWGGNWFFLVDAWGRSPDLPETWRTSPDVRMDAAFGTPGGVPHDIEQLTTFAWAIRQALQRHGIAGDDGAEIDHIELFGPPTAAGADSKNFVLCPGKAYDRSPCGTGTSAKVACLMADGKLQPGEVWRQESIIGSIFTATGEIDREMEARVIPTITGAAHITAEATLLLDPADPFRYGIGIK